MRDPGHLMKREWGNCCKRSLIHVLGKSTIARGFTEKKWRQQGLQEVVELGSVEYARVDCHVLLTELSGVRLT